MARLPAALAFTLLLGAVVAQEPGRPSQSSPVFSTSATAVLVDVVVRDPAGTLVADLETQDFTVFEDGVRQTVSSFQSASGAASSANAESRSVPKADEGRIGDASAATAVTPWTDVPQLVALVFENLGAEARAASEKAARTYLKQQRRGGEFIGVFAVDRALHTILPYTRDAASIERAVRTAAMRPGCPMYIAGDVAPAEAGPTGTDCREGISQGQFAVATMSSLRSLVEALQLVPGRKSVLLFSEGISLDVTSDVMNRFDALVGIANRSGVSFYTVDAAGLRARNPSAAIRTTLRTFSAEDQHSIIRHSVSPDEMMSGQPSIALGRLARETGGAFVDNTNALERAGQRLADDLRSHYLLAYVPTNPSLDGAFRRITVDVARPRVTVQARAGYLALPMRRTLAPHDVAPLLTLESGRLPNDFRLDAELTGGSVGVRIVGRVSHATLTYQADAESAPCRARLTLLARAVDKDGRTVWMNSDAHVLSSAQPPCEAARRSTTEFVRDVRLPPDAARIEVIAYDALADRASVRQLDVPRRTR